MSHGITPRFSVAPSAGGGEPSAGGGAWKGLSSDGDSSASAVASPGWASASNVSFDAASDPLWHPSGTPEPALPWPGGFGLPPPPLAAQGGALAAAAWQRGTGADALVTSSEGMPAQAKDKTHASSAPASVQEDPASPLLHLHPAEADATVPGGDGSSAGASGVPTLNK
mmetsp:Transcript_16406/g.41266  ORF Transcript_16406/g.41266 Transcript_16406/m.41266 type:complete len:169 (+) Transcript_16406:2-508(+)